MTDNDLRKIIREELKMALCKSVSPEKLMTTEEVARILNVKPQTLCLWRSRGNRGPSYQKISDSVRYKHDEVREWINAQTVTVR